MLTMRSPTSTFALGPTLSLYSCTKPLTIEQITSDSPSAQQVVMPNLVPGSLLTLTVNLLRCPCFTSSPEGGAGSGSVGAISLCTFLFAPSFSFVVASIFVGPPTASSRFPKRLCVSRFDWPSTISSCGVGLMALLNSSKAARQMPELSPFAACTNLLVSACTFLISSSVFPFGGTLFGASTPPKGSKSFDCTDCTDLTSLNTGIAQSR
mmetsp:Transcript_1789/g.3073  ORF Transcript_1789/g.3073 Transcript_1789/m.3073 type:complete len:209 (+) Transcript_1789:518-1144(+)